jgi:hypothetical protein
LDGWPQAARDKVFEIETAADAVHGAYVQLTEKYFEAGERVTIAERELAEAQSVYKPDPDRVAFAERRLANAREARARVVREREVFGERQRVLVGLADAMRRYTDFVGGPTKIAPHPAPRPKLRAGETAVAALARVRARIAAIKADDLPAALRARLPRAEIEATLLRHLDARAAAGKPTIYPDGSVDLPELHIVNEARPADYEPPARREVFDLLAFLFKDRLADTLRALLAERFPDDDGAMTADQRVARERALRDELLGLDRDEEGFILMLAADGAAVPRRPEADPRAVLEIDGPAPREP